MALNNSYRFIQKVRLILKSRFFLVAILVSGLAWSATPKKVEKINNPDTQDSRADLEFVASAGNYAITKNAYEESLRAALANGQKDTPELRRAVKEELINRALIAQAAEAEGLADAPEFKDKLAQARQNLLVQAYIEEFFRKEPITEEELRNEYERQKKLLGEGRGATQYQVSQIVVANESEAILLISRLEKGESFAGLARQYSIDASKKDGGLVGWVSPGQLPKALADQIVSYGKGDFTKAPIQVQTGWLIVKVDDKRSGKILSYDSVRKELSKSLSQQYIGEIIRRLRSTAKVVQ
ncbi:hypothetical protein G6731_08815 [Polynucleobacter paneuropaeus]|uniref:peptidylprolyl isomerase n=1 Tax=Polynucleobacter paneuropaeus TaxID=2527775 RepID=A0A9Q2ZWT2_9BURK|nr:hypothetical protein [Polynucleobacter paneuropaeus]